MSVKNVTELDFSTIRENLKTHLQNQSEFADYDFDVNWYLATSGFVKIIIHITMQFSPTWYLMNLSLTLW